jgi:hypothetical protein
MKGNWSSSVEKWESDNKTDCMPANIIDVVNCMVVLCNIARTVLMLQQLISVVMFVFADGSKVTPAALIIAARSMFTVLRLT